MSPFKRGDTYWASIPDESAPRKRRRVSLETGKLAEAKAREAELRNAAERERLGLEVRERNPRALSLSKACADHFAGRAKKQAQRGRVLYMVGKHIDGDAIGSMRLEKVTPGVLTEWLDRREAAGLAPVTCNRLRAAVSAVFSSLIEREAFRGENPAKKVRRRKEAQPKSRQLPPYAVPLLLAHAPTEGWRTAFALASYAGLRRGEIERLRWEDLDLAARMLLVRKSKTGVRRTVALHRELVQILDGVKRGELVVERAGWQKAATVLRNALERAEVEVDGGVQACFHGLRHTWATRLVDCGADPWVVQLMGWGPPKSSVMATSYARPTQALLDAIDKLSWPTGTVLEMKMKTKKGEA